MVRAVGAAELAPTSYAAEVRAERLDIRAGRRMVIKELDLSLSTGVHGVLGPNGAGKTTLIRAMATVQRPAGGTLELLGEAIGNRLDLRAVRRQLGYLPQEFGYYKRFTVREFVEYLAWLKEVPKAGVPDAVQHAIERVGLADRADDRLKTLSGGMIRRVGIAQAIVNDPRVLLLDEPTVGLDPAQRMSFRELLQDLGKQCCVVVSTHLVEDVAAACTEVLLVDDGRLVFQGTPGQLAEAGSAEDVGDNPTERGYTALLARGRSW
ncbi:ABC-type multidrug transport system ATPase subunit [Tamaricihabitans halophyticus]|uniref:ABC-type multidrug transport system ATPase subunit n=1 Tax=Tamaricihabitans halophyticus TaxID=1262583 RepID=A0A4R2QVL1_9PSEU|nr:ABC transporter ATP-binding protein [Tamaricihabitans halophyticus]TCP54103.1 ABC-type multidrug transport system ATPase subunit [Tamaricihabitans halophyticus]